MIALILSGLVMTGAGSAKKAKPAVPDFSMPALPALPTGNDLQQPKDQAPVVHVQMPVNPSQVTYSLVSVMHAQQFQWQADHYAPKFPIDKINLVNLPMTVASFHTLVRVRCAGHVGAPIEVRLLDPQGHPVLSSNGGLVFDGHDEAEYLVDWDPFTLYKSGTYHFEVRVAGQVIGSTPFPVIQALEAQVVATPIDAGSGAPAEDAGAPPPDTIQSLPY